MIFIDFHGERPHELGPRELQHDLGVQELLHELPQEKGEGPRRHELQRADLLELRREADDLRELSHDLQHDVEDHAHANLLQDLLLEDLLHVVLELPDLHLWKCALLWKSWVYIESHVEFH